MKKATLVIMAAGLGSRFGGGVKQLAPVGPSGEMIMDYSIYDALEAGFNKVVFIIRKDLEEEFKELIGHRIEKKVETAYVFQELSDIPLQYREKLTGRTKPWGTGQAVLCCRDVVKEPFLVINADDYYGKEAYREAYSYLTKAVEEPETDGKMKIGMVGFVLGNTLSENGAVTRGVCRVGQDGTLKEIKETYGIVREGDKAVSVNEELREEISLDSPVSMNMWALKPGFFHVLEEGFQEFLGSLVEEDVKKEYLLPQIIGGLVQENKAEVTVLRSSDRWFGVTYREDREGVAREIQGLIQKGVYPSTLI